MYIQIYIFKYFDLYRSINVIVQVKQLNVIAMKFSQNVQTYEFSVFIDKHRIKITHNID